MEYNLDSAKITKTALKLQARMQERFPTRGITEVAGEVCAATKEAAVVAARLKKPMIWYRVVAALCVLAIIGGLIALMAYFRPDEAEIGFVDLVHTFEAAVNDLIFICLAIFFIVRVERRLKRQRALDMLHRLRSLAHIIDMHQLTKDPDSVSNQHRTASSPVRDLTPYELNRYFDYCSELLAIISKLAALLVQDFDDPVTLNAVNEIESLTSGLSRKIWQKIIVATRTELVPELPVTDIPSAPQSPA